MIIQGKVVEVEWDVNIEKIFGVPFDLEIRGEMEAGMNQYDMKVIG